MRPLTLLWAALLIVTGTVGAMTGCHPSPEPETVAEAETLDVLRFESVVERWAEAERSGRDAYRRLVTSTPIQKRNDAVAIMAESFTSPAMVPLPGGEQAAAATQKVSEATPVLPVEKVTEPITDPLTKPKPAENRVLLLEVVDAAGSYHRALVHTEGVTPPPAFKDVAAKAPLAEFDRIDPLIMSLMEDAGAVNVPDESRSRPLVVITYFDGGAWDAVAFRSPTEQASSTGSAAPPQTARFSEVAAFALKHLPPEVGGAMRALAR